MGNQLFCYYSSLSFARSKNLDLFIDNYDYRFYRKDRKFYLDKFKINFKIIDKKIIKNYRYLHFSKIDFYLTKKFNLNLFKRNQKIIREEDLSFNTILKLIKPGCYLDGYWQNLSFLNNVKLTMQSELVLKNTNNIIEKLLSQITSSNSCGVHIRRSDYLIKPFSDIYYVCSEQYYRNAFEIINNRFKDTIYFFFTDDIIWAKKKFGNLKNSIFIKNYELSDYEEFFLLSKCKNHIISNSTFSLIAAWLNSDNNLVIEPRNWFKNKESGNKIVKDWIQLD